MMGKLGKLDRVNENLEKLKAMQKKMTARLSAIQKKEAALEQEIEAILSRHEQKQRRKERARKLILIGALVAKKYDIDLAKDVDLAALEEILDKKGG